jgi:D-alanine-D-alanine ligase
VTTIRGCDDGIALWARLEVRPPESEAAIFKRGDEVRVLVLMGGMSTERDVSLNTGRAVLLGLREAGHEVSEFNLGPAKGSGVVDLVNSRALEEADVVFIALHGGEGEDGRIQAVFDLVGKPYTGSGVRSSALCMDKAVSKILLEREGINTPKWECFRDGGAEAHSIAASVERVGGEPVVVKPVDQGSTIGISIVERREDLEEAITLARRYSPAILLEEYIAGRELSVPVIEDEVYPVVEIKPRTGFYDYERKYTKGMTDYECPADLPDGLRGRIEVEAARAYKVLGCEGVGRVDLRLGDNGIPYFLEVNTIPGMTETSLVPMGALARGVSFPELVDRITRYALRKAETGSPKIGG